MITCGREEIQRIKAGKPDIPHREAFSMAAKNVSYSCLYIKTEQPISFYMF
jgi:hypothetical protein